MKTKTNFHERIIKLSYCVEDIPKLDEAAYAVIGKMIMWGLVSDPEEPDSIQLASGSFRDKNELCLSYYEKFPISKGRGLSDKVASLRGDRCFTMAAILHDDGKWGTHS